MLSNTSPPGAHIGKYLIVAHIATGGMGSVYKARDEELDRIVALKILCPELADKPILVERFRREAIHASRLCHKNIVSLYECGQADGLYYLAMEFIEGIDLAEYIRRKGKLDPEEARRILRQARKALEHAFEQGITHRDIKPSNFLLGNEGGRCRVKLADLGLARMVNEEEFRVTRAGTTVGTVDYMAPEQARNSDAADVRSDIYSLGCTFYHMLAGRPPFNEGGVGQRVYDHMAATPMDVRTLNPGVSAAMWAVLRRMLAKNPDDRFQTPGELREALGAVAAVPSPPTSGDSDPEQEVAPVPRPPRSSRPSRLREEPPPPPRKPQTTLPERSGKTSSQADPLGVTPEQRSAAAAQFNHATEVIRAGGNSEYALQLLLCSCKLEPANVMYRKMLREVGRDAASGKRGGWLGSLSNLPGRGRIRAARHAGDHRKVLEHGEELLARLPGDIAAQIDMADSAEALQLDALAVWLLEEARLQAPRDPVVLRSLARIYERQERLPQAIAVWEQLHRVDPADLEASTQIKDLSVRDTIARGNYG